MESSISYGLGTSPFGKCFVAKKGEKICMLHFPETGDDVAQLLNELKQYFPNQEQREDNDFAETFCKDIFSGKNIEVETYLQGSTLQLSVWEVLKKIRLGDVVTYSQVAEMVGKPKAVRAVATAIGQNPISYLIPCHRVIRKNGDTGNYRWGSEKKQNMLNWEKGIIDSGKQCN